MPLTDTNPNGLPPGWAWASLSEFIGRKTVSVQPDIHPNKSFVLYSVPAFETRSPEVLNGSAIGSNKIAVHEGTVLLCKINPRINRAWTVAKHRPSDGQVIASTEWITFPKNLSVEPNYLRHFLSMESVRRFLAANVSGVGGSLMRARASTMASITLPLASVAEQRRIVLKIDELFGEIDAGEQELEKTREGLDAYRRSLLKAAVTGELTRDWREKNLPKESGADFLKRILDERRAAWERRTIQKCKAKGLKPKDSVWKSRYAEPRPPDAGGLPRLPPGWVWASLDQLSFESSYGTSAKCAANSAGMAVLRIPNIRNGTIDETNLKFSTTDLALGPTDAITPGDFLVVRTNGSEQLIGRAGLVLQETHRPSFFCIILDSVSPAGRQPAVEMDRVLLGFGPDSGTSAQACRYFSRPIQYFTDDARKIPHPGPQRG